MQRRFVLSVKIVLFGIIFFAISAFLSFFFINDLNTYTRVLMHELYAQKNIDVLFCGASHVSHGINPVVADKKLGLSVFNSGTPNQSLNGTYTILCEAIRLYNLKDVFVELDFATASTTPYSKAEPTKSTFLVAHYIKNPKAKLDFIFSSTSPKYYLNSLLPIGKEKLIDLNPASVFAVTKSKLTGEYYEYRYEKNDSVYAGKGCVLDDDAVFPGTLWSEPVNPIPVKSINQEWEDKIVKIIKLCKEKNINLAFYQNPSTDFYLTEKGNYDEYISFIRNFISAYDVPYYDFSLLKPEYLELLDSDFFDDNHLNKYGIEKFTNLFCDFYDKNELERREMFYSTFAEKKAAQPPKIYGLIIQDDKDNGFFTVVPVENHCDKNLISYDVVAFVSGGGEEEISIAEKSSESKFFYPKNSSGKIRITSFYNGTQQNCITKYYTAL